MSGQRINLAALRELAGNATPGPWAWEQVRKFRDTAYGHDWIVLDRNNKLIASLPPETVLALVEAVEAAQRVAGVPFGHISALDFYRLREALAPFVFGDEEQA